MSFLASIGTGLIQGGIQSLANLAQWKAQNKYNSPTNQMQRLEEAGLNPNLIYGSSAGGAAGNAGPVAPASAPGISAYQDYKIKQGQIRQLDLQNQGIEQDNRVKKVAGDKAEQRNYFGMGPGEGQVNLPKIDPETGAITYDPVATPFNTNYSREAYEEFMLKMERRYAAQVSNVLNSMYDGPRRRAVLKKIHEDMLNTIQRTGAIADSRAAYKGFSNIVNSFGGDTPTMRAIMEAVKYLMLKR